MRLSTCDESGVSFEEAATIFADPDGLDGEDSDHSQHEQRRQRIAVSIAGRILFVVYTLRRTGHEKRETIRVISARQASRKERKAYFRLSH
ncbi:MAG: BrnT family toxin [Nitrospira sp.]|nr:BrnT family toxin [Nitrospira sp.]